jgi:DNA-binding transcriptional ArsR family regulator
MSSRLAWRVAVRDSNLDPTAKHVALTLDTYMNSRGLAWPARQTLAEGVGVSVRTLDRALSRLSQSGFVIVMRGRGRRPNLYRANNPSSDTHVAPSGSVVATNATVVATNATRSSDTHVAQSRKKPYEAVSAHAQESKPQPEPRASAGAYKQHEGAPHKVAIDQAMVVLAKGWLK